MATSPLAAIEPEGVLRDLLAFDPGLRQERYWGERSIFYNPGTRAPLGVIFASIKDHDGENDRSSQLSREGVYRFAFCLPRDVYADMFGDTPARPRKGRVVDLADYDPARLQQLLPHPVYAWMRWVQILSPTREQYRALRPHLAESLALVKAKSERRKAT